MEGTGEGFDPESEKKLACSRARGDQLMFLPSHLFLLFPMFFFSSFFDQRCYFLPFSSKMFRASNIFKLQRIPLYNRTEEMKFFRRLTTNPGNYFLVGPPSSGKTALVTKLLEMESIPSFHIDCRCIKRLGAEDAFLYELGGFKRRLKEHVTDVVNKSVCALTSDAVEEPLMIPSERSSVIQQLHDLIVSQDKLVVIFVDEVNVLRPKLNEHGVPLDAQEKSLAEFFNDFQRLCIATTKKPRSAWRRDSSSCCAWDTWLKRKCLLTSTRHLP
ncbi:MAG: ATP-binding protein [Bacteroidetes bacterium]|nr:ATP-binding protein [Bacteroidota bacterium]